MSGEFSQAFSTAFDIEKGSGVGFDRSNAADLAALKSEVNTDPITMGYNPTGPTQQLLNLLNDPSNNVGGETIQAVLTPRSLWEAAADNSDDLTPHGQFSEGDQIAFRGLLEITANVDDDISWARTRVQNLFPAQDGIRQDLEAQVRDLSRAEVLFGENTNISRLDWAAARDS